MPPIVRKNYNTCNDILIIITCDIAKYTYYVYHMLQYQEYDNYKVYFTQFYFKEYFKESCVYHNLFWPDQQLNNYTFLYLCAKRAQYKPISGLGWATFLFTSCMLFHF